MSSNYMPLTAGIKLNTHELWENRNQTLAEWDRTLNEEINDKLCITVALNIWNNVYRDIKQFFHPNNDISSNITLERAFKFNARNLEVCPELISALAEKSLLRKWFEGNQQALKEGAPHADRNNYSFWNAHLRNIGVTVSTILSNDFSQIIKENKLPSHLIELGVKWEGKPIVEEEAKPSETVQVEAKSDDNDIIITDEDAKPAPVKPNDRFSEISAKMKELRELQLQPMKKTLDIVNRVANEVKTEKENQINENKLTVSFRMINLNSNESKQESKEMSELEKLEHQLKNELKKAECKQQ